MISNDIYILDVCCHRCLHVHRLVSFWGRLVMFKQIYEDYQWLIYMVVFMLAMKLIDFIGKL